MDDLYFLNLCAERGWNFLCYENKLCPVSGPVYVERLSTKLFSFLLVLYMQKLLYVLKDIYYIVLIITFSHIGLCDKLRCEKVSIRLFYFLYLCRDRKSYFLVLRCFLCP